MKRGPKIIYLRRKMLVAVGCLAAVTQNDSSFWVLQG